MRCRSCNAEIRFCKTVRGKSMPVDPAPHPDGNLSIDDENVAHVLAGEALEIARANNDKLFVSHFATCPNATKHRRK